MRGKSGLNAAIISKLNPATCNAAMFFLLTPA
jgi:hypothetical protein